MSDFPPGRFGYATIFSGGALTPAIVTDSGVMALQRLIGDDAPISVRAILIDSGEKWIDRILAAIPGARGWSAVDEVDFAPPLPDPSNLYLAGANYWDHIAEMNVTPPDKAVDDVFHFMVPSSSLVGSGHDVLRPQGVQQLDWEVELAAVIGRRAESVRVEDALDFVAGYAVANDISARGPSTFHPVFGLRFLHAKGQATLKPMGPVIVPARFVPDPGKLALSTQVNGEPRQKSNTQQMVWTLPEQISYLSSRAPLLPGDIILTGTPAGTAVAYHDAYLADGDIVTARVEGLGVLTNRIAGHR